MGDTSTQTLPTSSGLAESSFVRGIRAQPLIAAPQEKVARVRAALREIDEARTWESLQEAKARLLELGHGCVSAVLFELSFPQPSERHEVLTEFVACWVPAERIYAAVAERGNGAWLRAALVHSMGLQVADPSQGKVSASQIASFLKSYAKDMALESVIRLAAVEALVAVTPATLSLELVELLRAVAREDPNPTVQEEARSALEDIEPQ